jgi:hypothetical protein
LISRFENPIPTETGRLALFPYTEARSENVLADEDAVRVADALPSVLV